MRVLTTDGGTDEDRIEKKRGKVADTDGKIVHHRAATVQDRQHNQVPRHACLHENTDTSQQRVHKITHVHSCVHTPNILPKKSARASASYRSLEERASECFLPIPRRARERVPLCS